MVGRNKGIRQEWDTVAEAGSTIDRLNTYQAFAGAENAQGTVAGGPGTRTDQRAQGTVSI